MSQKEKKKKKIEEMTIGESQKKKKRKRKAVQEMRHRLKDLARSWDGRFDGSDALLLESGHTQRAKRKKRKNKQRILGILREISLLTLHIQQQPTPNNWDPIRYGAKESRSEEFWTTMQAGRSDTSGQCFVCSFSFSSVRDKEKETKKNLAKGELSV